MEARPHVLIEDTQSPDLRIFKSGLWVSSIRTWGRASIKMFYSLSRYNGANHSDAPSSVPEYVNLPLLANNSRCSRWTHF